MQPVVLNLYNPTTGQITELNALNRRLIAHNEIVLLSHENPQDLIDLQAAWQKEFPGKSQSLITQREILLKSDWHRRRLATALEELQLDLAFTGIPLQHWDPQLLKRFDALHRINIRASRNFTQAHKALEIDKPAAKPVKEKPPPEPATEITGTYLYQSVGVKVIDGKTVTWVDLDAKHWLTHPVSEYTIGYCRQIRFENCFVPPEYAYALEHDGIPHAPARTIFLYYSIEEFLRLCQLELDTGSEHLLDQGIRLKTGRLV